MRLIVGVTKLPPRDVPSIPEVIVPAPTRIVATSLNVEDQDALHWCAVLNGVTRTELIRRLLRAYAAGRFALPELADTRQHPYGRAHPEAGVPFNAPWSTPTDPENPD